MKNILNEKYFMLRKLFKSHNSKAIFKYLNNQYLLIDTDFKTFVTYKKHLSFDNIFTAVRYSVFEILYVALLC